MFDDDTDIEVLELAHSPKNKVQIKITIPKRERVDIKTFDEGILR